MKLHIRKNAFIGDPEIGAELEIAANDKVFDIEIVKEQMFFQGMDFGIRPAVIKATTTSADDYKSWDELGTFGVDSGMACIWNVEEQETVEWSEIDGVYGSNQNGDLIDGIVATAGLGDGVYPVYVKRENGEVTDFVIDFRDED